MSLNYNQFLCPLCGKTNQAATFDPSEFKDDVIGLRFRGLGRGRGWEISEEGSLLGSEVPVLKLLSDRVGVLYDMLYEGDEFEEALDESNEKYGTNHETLLEAFLYVSSWLDDFLEEEPDEVDLVSPHSPQPVTQEPDDEDDWDEEEPETTEPPLDELGREILIGEYEEP